jgi:predicted dehydrogenase
VGSKIRWGVLGAAAIAVKKVVPGMKHCTRSEVVAIASRSREKAEAAARALNIANAYGSYEELLADPEIDAIYNPLPNHLHAPWSIRAADAGKHVLCEKPIALSSAECREMIAVRDRTGVKMGEAFMVRTHPQWLRAREIVRSGRLGPLRSILGFFSYYNVNRDNIRNIAEYGGGGVMDIGCYPITISRWMFDEEPTKVLSTVERDPDTQTDRLASVVLEFPSGQSIFTCSTQLVPYQRMQFFGTRGRLEIEIPFNAPPDRPCRIYIDNGSDLFGGGIEPEQFVSCDQYGIQADAFARAIQENGPVPVPLEDALKNMEVIEKILQPQATAMGSA